MPEQLPGGPSRWNRGSPVHAFDRHEPDQVLGELDLFGDILE